MQIVIDIPDEWKTRIEYNQRPNTIECGELVESIWRGKILPKNHGRLIDADVLDEAKEMVDTTGGGCKYAVRMDNIRLIPSIIKADREAEK